MCKRDRAGVAQRGDGVYEAREVIDAVVLEAFEHGGGRVDPGGGEVIDVPYLEEPFRGELSDAEPVAERARCSEVGLLDLPGGAEAPCAGF